MTLLVNQPNSGENITYNVVVPNSFAARTVASQYGADYEGVTRFWPIYDSIGALLGYLPSITTTIERLFGIHLPGGNVTHVFTGSKPIARPYDRGTATKTATSWDVLINITNGKQPLPLIPQKERDVEHIVPHGVLEPVDAVLPGYTVSVVNATYASKPIAYVTRKRLTGMILSSSSSRPFWRTSLNLGTTYQGADIQFFLDGQFANRTTSSGSYTTVKGLVFEQTGTYNWQIRYEHHTKITVGGVEHTQAWRIVRTFELLFNPPKVMNPSPGSYTPNTVTLVQYYICEPIMISVNPSDMGIRMLKITSTPIIIPTGKSGVTSFDRQSLSRMIYGQLDDDKFKTFKYHGGLFGAVSKFYESNDVILNSLARAAFVQAIGKVTDNVGEGVNLAESALEYDQLFDTLATSPESLDILFDAASVPQWARQSGITKMSDFRRLRFARKEQLKAVFKKSAGLNLIDRFKATGGVKAVARSVASDYLRLIFGVIPAVSLLWDVPAVAAILHKMGAAYSGVGHGTVRYAFEQPPSDSPFSAVDVIANAKIRHSLPANSLGSVALPWSAAGFAPWHLGTWVDLVPSSWLWTSLSKQLRDFIGESDRIIDSMLVGVDYTVASLKLTFTVRETFINKYSLRSSSPNNALSITAFVRRVVPGIFPDNGVRVLVGDNNVNNGMTIGAYALLKIT